MMRKKIQITNDDPTADEAVNGTSANETTNGESADASAQSSEGVHDTSGAEAYIVALQADLEDARTRADEAEKRILYTQAEFHNFRRRKEEEFKEVQRIATAELIVKLLPVVDSFERALGAAIQTRNIDSLLVGLNGTMKQLTSFLEKSGVTPIDAIGKEFDPSFHEAIGHTESEDLPPHTVAEEVQRGYVLQERVLRPSLVKVTEG